MDLHPGRMPDGQQWDQGQRVGIAERFLLNAPQGRDEDVAREEKTGEMAEEWGQGNKTIESLGLIPLPSIPLPLILDFASRSTVKSTPDNRQTVCRARTHISPSTGAINHSERAFSVFTVRAS